VERVARASNTGKKRGESQADDCNPIDEDRINFENTVLNLKAIDLK